MLLAIDSGNTNIVFAVFDGASLKGAWRTVTDPRKTADDYVIWLTQLMAMESLKREDVSAVAIANVVPEAVHSLQRLATRYFGCQPLIVGDPAVRLSSKALVDRPEEVGADRLVNALAAHRQYGGPLIVVDCGTATTFDVVNSEGNYLGGAIAPGPTLSLKALHDATAKLPGVTISRPSRVIGTNTITAMQSGIYWGYVGLIEGMVARTKSDYLRDNDGDAGMKVIATGGLAPLFEQGSSVIDFVDQEITLTGLRFIHEDNA